MLLVRPLALSDSVYLCVRTTPCRHFGNVRLFPMQPKESVAGLDNAIHSHFSQTIVRFYENKFQKIPVSIVNIL